MAGRVDYLKEIPKEAKSWKNGTLYATSDGRIFKEAKFGYLECKKTPKGKDKGNCVYYYGLDGKDKVSYVYKIIAELFCPKENTEQRTVKAKDGNLENDCSTNLYWHMNRESIRKMKKNDRLRTSFDIIPDGFIKVPTFEDVYINDKAVVIVKGKDGRFSYLEKKVSNNKNTPVYMMSIYNYKTKKSKHIGLHVLMGLTFLKQPSEKHVNVYFKDGNGLNLDIDNLYWCTHVAPVNISKEAKERFFEKLPEECVKAKYDTYISKNGRVFISKYAGYLELMPHVDKRTGDLKINIPIGQGKSRYYRIVSLLAEAYIPIIGNVSTEVYFKDNNKLNINLSNLYRRNLTYGKGNGGKIDYDFLDELPTDVKKCNNYDEIYINKNGDVFYKAKNNKYKKAQNHKMCFNGSNIIMAKINSPFCKRSFLNVAELLYNTYVDTSNDSKVLLLDGNPENIRLDNLYVIPSIKNNKEYNKHVRNNTYIESLPMGFIQCFEKNDLWISKECEIYQYIKDKGYKKIIIKRKKFGKTSYEELYINYINNGTHQIKVSTLVYETFNNKPLNNYKIVYKDTNPENVSIENLELEEKNNTTFSNKSFNYIEKISDEYALYKKIPSLYINKDGDVYQFFENKGYKHLNHNVETKHGHEVILVRYLNSDGKSRAKSVAIMLAETFLLNNQDCPHIIFKDGNYLNISLNNISFAGNKYRECPSCGAFNENKNSNCNKCNYKLILESKNYNLFNYSFDEEDFIITKLNDDEEKYISSLGEDFVKCINTNDLYINKDGDVYQFFENKGYKKCVISSELKNNHKVKLTRYINENGDYRVKHLARLLAENFLLDGDNCPRIAFKDNNSENVVLDNITFAGNNQIECNECGTFNLSSRINCRMCNKILKEPMTNINNSRYRFNIVDSIPEEAKKTYIDYVYITENGEFYVMYNDGIYHYSDIKESNNQYIILRDENRTRVNLKNALAEAFVDNPQNYTRIVCIDCDLNNLNVTNLKWVSEEEAKNYRPLKYCPDCGKNKIDYAAKICDDCKLKKKEEQKEERANKVIDEAQMLLDKLNPKDNTRIILEELVNGLTTPEIWEKYNWTRQYVNSCLNKARLKASDEYQNEKLTKKMKKIYEKKFTDVCDYEFFEKVYPYVIKNCENSDKVIIRNSLQNIDMIGNQFETLEELILHTDRQLSINRTKRKKEIK